MVWERDESFRRQIERVARQTLRATGDCVELTRVTTEEELAVRIARSPIDIAIIDEESTAYTSDAAIRAASTCSPRC